MKELRIVFMGTPDFAVATLSALLEAEYKVVGVITAPDRPAGRGQKIRQSAVKTFAQENNLKILQPTNLKYPEFLEELKSLRPNLQIVVAFRMLPKLVWALPEYGTFNLHASLLPNYRGAAPINWAIMNGEKETGVTTFFIDDKIDTGEIILQKKTTVEDDEDAGSLHNKLMRLGSHLVVETVRLIEDGKVTTQKQEHIKGIKSAYKINKDTCEIDWTKSIDSVYNHIRGLSPYPASWTTLYNNNQKSLIKIYKVTKELIDHELTPGSLQFTKKELKVAVKNGFLNLLEIQLQGKRKMKTSEVLNGLKLAKTAHMG
jgi:methionyl-tRNA formyltransferase